MHFGNLFLLFTAAITLGLSSCATEQKRVPVPPPSSVHSDLPWNRLQPGEAQGQFGAFQRQ